MNRKRTWLAAIVVVAGALGVSAFAFRSTPADAAPKAVPASADQSASDPPFGTFLGACSTNADCSGGNVCASFKKRGNHCTHACQKDSECGSSDGRCTKQNRCGLREPKKTEP